jgi:hypothetical protein
MNFYTQEKSSQVDGVGVCAPPTNRTRVTQPEPPRSDTIDG